MNCKKKSSQLLLDLEQVSSVISLAQGFLGSDSKMQKINKINTKEKCPTYIL